MTLTAAVIFFKGSMFVIVPARKLKFVAVKHIPSQTVQQISKILNKVIKLYVRVGFIISVILMDMEFEKVAEMLGTSKSTLQRQENTWLR